MGRRILIVLIVLLAAGVAMRAYRGDWFEERKSERDLANWTGEDIAAAPRTYLDLCDETLRDALARIEFRVEKRAQWREIAVHNRRIWDARYKELKRVRIGGVPGDEVGDMSEDRWRAWVERQQERETEIQDQFQRADRVLNRILQAEKEDKDRVTTIDALRKRIETLRDAYARKERSDVDLDEVGFLVLEAASLPRPIVQPDSAPERVSESDDR